MADRIPIAAAEKIGKENAYDQVIVYARRVGSPGLEWVTTWGRDKTHCDAAARIGDAIGRKVVAPLEEKDREIARLRDLLKKAAEALEDATEGGEIAAQLAENIRDKGNYSNESMITFLGQIPMGCTSRDIMAEIGEALSHG